MNIHIEVFHIVNDVGVLRQGSFPVKRDEIHTAYESLPYPASAITVFDIGIEEAASFSICGMKQRMAVSVDESY